MREFFAKTILIVFGLLFYFSSNAQQCIYTIGGTGTNGFSGDGGPATLATMFAPRGITIDNAGNVYFIDALNVRIRKITPSGIITTVAGCGLSGFSGDGGPAILAKFFSVDGIVVDTAGNLYLCDMNNYRIRKVNTAGIITTIAGNGVCGFSGDGGPASAASICGPNGIAIDGSGNIYFYNRAVARIRKINTSGIISTIAGNGTTGFSGDGGPATAASLGDAYGLAVDGLGNIYTSEANNHRIRKINTSGVINTIAGTGTAGFSGDGGIGTSAQINNPFGIAADASGNVYFCDNLNRRIRQINTGGIITTVVGTGGVSYNGDGIPPLSAQLDPLFLALDPSNNMYISDYNNERIRKITAATPSMPINTTPSVNLTICAGNSTTLSATGTAILGWYTSATGGTYLGGGTTLNTSTLSTTATFYVQDSSACAVSLRRAITVTVNPIPTITVNSGSICIGESFTIVPGGAGTYTFSGGGSIVSPTTTTSYSVSGTNTAGCTSTNVAISSITVNTLPTVTAASNPTIICNGQSATLIANGANTYSWSTMATTASITVAPSAATNYSVNGTDVNGCKNSFTLSVGVSNPQLTLTPAEPTCNGLCNGSITFTAGGGMAPYTYTPSSATGLCAGMYTIYATDNIGCIAVKASLLTQPAPLVINATNINSVTCNGACNGNFIMNASGGTPAYSYTPSVTSGLCAGVYTLMVSDANACAAISSVTIIEPLPLTATIVSSNSVICSGSSNTLIVNHSGGTPPFNYIWNTSNTTQSIIISPTTSAVYSVTVSDVNGCFTFDSYSITVNPTPTVVITGPSGPVCTGSTACLNASPGGATYSWVGPCGFSSGIQNPCFPFFTFCGCIFTCTVTNSFGCANSNTYCIATNPNPTVTAATSNSIICSGQTSTLTANGAFTYSWSTSATGSTTAVSPTTTTNYSVVGTDSNGCTNTANITQSVSACTGINEFVNNAGFQFYPNPTSGEITLKLTSKENLNLEIYNTIGQLILKQTITENETKIDLKQQATSVYFIKLLKENTPIHYSKIIKE